VGGAVFSDTARVLRELGVGREDAERTALDLHLHAVRDLYRTIRVRRMKEREHMANMNKAQRTGVG
jgi:hypothetical protein